MATESCSFGIECGSLTQALYKGIRTPLVLCFHL